MAVTLRVTITILGIAAIGRLLASASSPQYALGELILLGAFMVLVRECLRLREVKQDLLRCRDPFVGIPGGPYARAVPSDFGRLPAGSRAEPIVDFSAEISTDDSVEEIAHVMVTQAFRKVSLKYHPDHGGDPEIMRRVYEAREMMLRAIRRN
jgi:hypothetical protein